MWVKVLLLLVILFAVILYGLACLLFHAFFYRPKRSKKVPDYYVDTPHYKVSRAGMAIMDQLPVEDKYLTSRDGLKLHAYLYPAEGDSHKKFVLGIHGYRSYARPEFGPYIAFYRSLGYSMLLPDDRAHGPSEGKYIGFGVLDRLDCVDWAKWLVQEYGEDVEIILHGVSMGGATVLAASGEEDLPQQVQGTIADCGFTSVWDVFSYQFRQVVHLPKFPLLPLIQRISLHRAGIDFRKNSAKEQVQKAHVPILFVQGGKDPMVPAFMAKELYDACTSRKELLMVEDAGHAESIALAPDRYHEAIHRFFEI